MLHRKVSLTLPPGTQYKTGTLERTGFGLGLSKPKVGSHSAAPSQLRDLGQSTSPLSASVFLSVQCGCCYPVGLL